MRRPLPPELVELGDQLEAAAVRVLARRRTRRQLVLNAAASLVVAVPVTVALTSTQLSTTTVPVTTATPAPAASQVVSHVSAPAAARDVLPRDLRHLRLSPQSELLLLPSSLRPALR